MKSPRPVEGVIDVVNTLRNLGIDCPADSVQCFAAAVQQFPLVTPQSLWAAGRSTLCRTAETQRLFDDLMSDLGAHIPGPETPTLGRGEETIVTGHAEAEHLGPEAESRSQVVVRAVASTQPQLRGLDFAAVPDDWHPRLITEVRRATQSLVRRAYGGPASAWRHVDVAATIRALVKFDGDLPALSVKAAGSVYESVDIAVDLSGSMSPYADALLTFAFAFADHYPGSVRICALGMGFTDLTKRARTGRTRHAPMQPRVNRGGTQLGRSLAVMGEWRVKQARSRRPQLVIFSDGWDGGGHVELHDAMTRLRRLYRNIVWANPHVAKQGYQPVQRGIMVALPHVDHLTSGHSVDALAAIIALLGVTG